MQTGDGGRRRPATDFSSLRHLSGRFRELISEEPLTVSGPAGANELLHMQLQRLADVIRLI